MPTQHSPQTQAPEPLTEAGSLAASLLLFLVLVILFNACGTDDLVFPGNIPNTPTPQNTATPAPTSII